MFRVWGLGFGVSGSAYGVWLLQDEDLLHCRVQVSGLKEQGLRN